MALNRVVAQLPPELFDGLLCESLELVEVVIAFFEGIREDAIDVYSIE